MSNYSYLLGKSAKIDKSDKYSDYENFIMYLAPSDESGHDVCPNESAGCRAACLYTAGRGRFTATKTARLNRTLHYISNRVDFIYRLTTEVVKLTRKYSKLAIRLNGTSDLNWMPFLRKMHQQYPNIVWYDYTKNPKFALAAKEMPYYHVTFSRSEDNEEDCKKMLANGINVAVVFRKELPEYYLGHKVIDGDVSDTRFLDETGMIIGLIAKGKAKKDKSGFVVDL